MLNVGSWLKEECQKVIGHCYWVASGRKDGQWEKNENNAREFVKQHWEEIYERLDIADIPFGDTTMFRRANETFLCQFFEDKTGLSSR